jgi:hypothetical protein
MAKSIPKLEQLRKIMAELEKQPHPVVTAKLNEWKALVKKLDDEQILAGTYPQGILVMVYIMVPCYDFDS